MNISEIFATVQGEGPNTGKSTVFVRAGLCNLRCPGWGSTTIIPGREGEEVGCCDTPYAVFPEFRSQWMKMSPAEIMREVEGYVPQHVCLTGGEPLLQPARELADLVHKLLMREYTIDLFTNGTKLLPEWTGSSGVTVCMDWKMPSSGEYQSFNEYNLRRLQRKDMIKFVIDIDNDDDKRALNFHVLEIQSLGVQRPDIYVGPVWGTDTEKLANYLVAWYPDVRLSIQSHNYIFSPGTDGTSDRRNQETESSNGTSESEKSK